MAHWGKKYSQMDVGKRFRHVGKKIGDWISQLIYMKLMKCSL